MRDHSRRHIAMTQQFLHGADIITRLKNLRGKAMAKLYCLKRILSHTCRFEGVTLAGRSGFSENAQVLEPWAFDVEFRIPTTK